MSTPVLQASPTAAATQGVISPRMLTAALMLFLREERQRLSFHPLPLRSDSLHLLLSKQVPGNAERMARFNRGLKALQDSGRVSQYLLEIQQPLSLTY